MMKRLKYFEASDALDFSPPPYDKMDRLAASAIMSYIQDLFLKDCKKYAYAEMDDPYYMKDEVYYSIRIMFHSVNKDVMERLDKLCDFLDIEYNLDVFGPRVGQMISIPKNELVNLANNLETLANSNKYNL